MPRIRRTLTCATQLAATFLRPTTAAAIFSTVVLSACGNAYESLSIGKWREAGTPQPPISAHDGDLVVKRIPGRGGRTVRPGDLVRMRITATSGRFESYGMLGGVPQTHTLWLWTGREPENRDVILAWGDLGSDRLRRALIGGAINERLEMRLEANAGSLVMIPLNGFWTQDYYLLADAKYRWPEIHFYKEVVAEVEILDACPGRLYRRSARMTQLGFTLNMFDSNYKPARSGTLRWSALEGECGPAGQKMRFEVGPVYERSYGTDPVLYGWDESYSSLGDAIIPIRLGMYVWLLVAFAIVTWFFRRSKSAIVRLALALAGALFLLPPAVSAEMMIAWMLFGLAAAVWVLWPIFSKPNSESGPGD